MVLGDMRRKTSLTLLLVLQLLVLLRLNTSAKGICFMRCCPAHIYCRGPQNHLKAVCVLTIVIVLSACTVHDLQRNLSFELLYGSFMCFLCLFHSMGETSKLAVVGLELLLFFIS